VQAQIIPEDDRPAARPPAVAPIFRPAHLKALEALSGSGAAYLLLRLPVPGQEPTKDLDLLVSHDSLGSATAALERAGFRPLTAPIGLPSKVEFMGYDGGCFCSLDVHTSVVSHGLVYLDSRTLLERRRMEGGVPLPSPEDSLLHLVLHPFLSRREIGGKYAGRIRELAALDLDRGYISRHLARFGLEQVFDPLLRGVLGESGIDADRLWRRARRGLLLRVPGNIWARARYRAADRLKLRRRAGLIAFMGVDGVGKSTIVGTLESLLTRQGLRTSAVYMGSWGNYQTRVQWVGSYSPRDRPVEGETRGAALIRKLKNIGKFGIFYGGILYEQAVRYRRVVFQTTSDIVLSDRYLYDLEVPFSRGYVRAGRRLRFLIYRLFPAPDLVFHLKAEASQILARKAELSEENIRRFDRIYGETLAGRRVIRVPVDLPAEALAQRIIEENWEKLLEACWRHAPRNPLRRYKAA